jgi:transcription elongation factor GreA
MSNYTYLSQEGYDRLKEDLEKMKSEGREEVAKAIAEAREKGDLSENAEYDAAKDAQGLLEMRINELEKMFANARVLDRSQVDTSKVTVLSTVTIKNRKTGMEVAYQLVAQAEANLKAKKISVSSPIGEGLLGKEVGDIAHVQTPNGAIEFEILKIEF